MSEPTILMVKLPTCGNCHFTKAVSLGVVECWGLPPTPVVMGGKPNLAGQVELQIELLRPQMSTQSPACALHRMKAAPGMPGLGGAMAGNG